MWGECRKTLIFNSIFRFGFRLTRTHHYYPGFIIDEVNEASEENLDQDEEDDKIEYSSGGGWGRTTSADDNILRNVLRGKRERTISEVQNTKHSLAAPSNATNKAFIKRNVSTPGFGRLARLDSVQEREVQQILSGSSALVYEVQVLINFLLLKKSVSNLLSIGKLHNIIN